MVGTRPNMMKIAPIAAELARRGDEFEHVLVHTGQHYDREMSAIFLEELGVGEPDYALSVILNSSLQVALGLTPVLVLLSFVLGGAHLTLVLPPLLVAAVGLATALGALIVYDGESTWLEGLVLIGLYAIIATSFWWG